MAAAGLAALFVVVALWQVSPAISGPFLADDNSYIVHNAYVHEVSWENLRGILDPWGEPTAYTANYAPVHLLAHALEYAAFGPDEMIGWHVVNAVLHAVAALLVAAFLLRHGLPGPAAAFGGALFLVHPANAETVAWIFQLKTILSLALALGALLLLERRPVLATLLFALALLTKITALFALPVALARAWVTSRGGRAAPRPAWLGAWAAVALVLSVLALQAYYGVQADPRASIHEDPLVHARSVVAIAMRYLAMAYAAVGLSTFHEPPPAVSWLDPWWLAGLVALTGLGLRAAWALRRREEEAVFWVLAAASFAPVSQVIPFLYPMGDRYLYPILPGLIGGTLLALRRPAARLAAAWPAGLPPWKAAATLAALLLVGGLALRSAERSAVFRDPRSMMLDAALHYPDGVQAHLLRGFRAAREGDAPAAARSYGRAVELGYSNLHSLLAAPHLAGVREHPAFQAMLREAAVWDVERLEGREDLSQMELDLLGRAYEVRGEPGKAIRAYERGLTREGPLAAQMRERLAELRPPPGERDVSDGRGAR